LTLKRVCFLFAQPNCVQSEAKGRFWCPELQQIKAKISLLFIFNFYQFRQIPGRLIGSNRFRLLFTNRKIIAVGMMKN
jgi:hypothetical protein